MADDDPFGPDDLYGGLFEISSNHACEAASPAPSMAMALHMDEVKELNGKVKELQQLSQQLEQQLEHERQKNAQLDAERSTLVRNISSLYKTAVMELEWRSSEIKQLQAQLQATGTATHASTHTIINKPGLSPPPTGTPPVPYLSSQERQRQVQEFFPSVSKHRSIPHSPSPLKQPPSHLTLTPHQGRPPPHHRDSNSKDQAGTATAAFTERGTGSLGKRPYEHTQENDQTPRGNMDQRRGMEANKRQALFAAPSNTPLDQSGRPQGHSKDQGRQDTGRGRFDADGRSTDPSVGRVKSADDRAGCGEQAQGQGHRVSHGAQGSGDHCQPDRGRPAQGAAGSGQGSRDRAGGPVRGGSGHTRAHDLREGGRDLVGGRERSHVSREEQSGRDRHPGSDKQYTRDEQYNQERYSIEESSRRNEQHSGGDRYRSSGRG